MSNIIFYFSGTGNSLAVARSIANELQDTDVVPMLALRENKEIPTKYSKVGFIFPCYYVHTPEIVMDLIKDLLIQRHQLSFAIVTYGGDYGYALYDIAQQLQSKTDNPVQTFSVRMPGNHIVGYSAWPEWLQKILLKRAAIRTGKIATKLRNGAYLHNKKKNQKLFFAKNYIVSYVNKKLGVKDIKQKNVSFQLLINVYTAQTAKRFVQPRT